MKDIYQQMTDAIIGGIDEAGSWEPCWHGLNAGMPVNAASKRRYRGINILSCWVSARNRGYASQRWASFKQWQELGGRVRRGEKGTPIIFYSVKENEEKDERRAFIRSSYVFNAEQVEGIEAPEPAPLLDEAARIASCEAWLAERAHAFKLTHSDENRAYFHPASDTVNMPAFGLFHTGEHYYSTLFHELTHWTGVKSRLARSDLDTYQGESRAREELVAELGAAFLSAEHGITHVTRADHTSYIASWLKHLKNDKRAIVTAASLASAAADYLTGLAAEERMAA